ncbi:MAG: hypothetical protein AB7I18_10355 [Candidatus Berkiella sp.]
MAEDEQQEYNEKINESLALIDSIGESEFAKIMIPKRKEMEELFRSQSPFTDQNAINIIINYALILDEHHSQEEKEATKRRERYEHLLVACFNAGYALGVGKDCPSALPIMALAALNIDMGKKLLAGYTKQTKSAESKDDSNHSET